MSKHDKSRSPEQIAAEIMDAIGPQGEGSEIAQIRREARRLTRPEAVRRIQNTLRGLATDKDRLAVLSSLALLYEAT
jgi:hypothetical protein